MLEVRHSLIFVCRARRPQTPGIWPPPSPLRVHPIVSRAPACTPLGYLRASIFHHLTVPGSTRLVSGRVVGACLCVCVAGGTRVISQLLQYQGERREEIIMYSKGALQSPIQWHAIPSRCFITYSFTIIGRDFCPFARVYTHNSPL